MKSMFFVLFVTLAFVPPAVAQEYAPVADHQYDQKVAELKDATMVRKGACVDVITTISSDDDATAESDVRNHFYSVLREFVARGYGEKPNSLCEYASGSVVGCSMDLRTTAPNVDVDVTEITCLEPAAYPGDTIYYVRNDDANYITRIFTLLRERQQANAIPSLSDLNPQVE